MEFNTDKKVIVNIDELTIVLQPKAKVQCVQWENISKDIVQTAVGKLKVIPLFGKLVHKMESVVQGYTECLTYEDILHTFAICWHTDYCDMGICIKFSAHAYAVYKREYEKKYGTAIFCMDLIKMIQDEKYVTRISRIDLVADYFNYPCENVENLLTVNEIYNKYKNGNYLIVNYKGKNFRYLYSGIEKNGKMETFYIGSKKKNTKGFLRIYDKKIEQIQTKGYLYEQALQCQSWIRFEVVLKREYAHEITEIMLCKINDKQDLQKAIAKFITDKYRFFDSDNKKFTKFTEDLLKIANGSSINALQSLTTRDNSLRKSMLYLQNNSGLFTVLYKILNIWGESAIDAVFYYWKDYFYNKFLPVAESRENMCKDAKYWLKKHKKELESENYNDCLF